MNLNAHNAKIIDLSIMGSSFSVLTIERVESYNAEISMQSPRPDVSRDSGKVTVSGETSIKVSIRSNDRKTDYATSSFRVGGTVEADDENEGESLDDLRYYLVDACVGQIRSLLLQLAIESRLHMSLVIPPIDVPRILSVMDAENDKEKDGEE